MKEFLLALIRRIVLPVFSRAGFTYEQLDQLEGWLSRDPYTDDWILWAPRTEQMYRRKDQEGASWQPSPESKSECLKLGRVYAELVGIRL